MSEHHSQATVSLEFAEGDLIAIFQKAAEIDPEAWASPLPDRLQKRRNESFKRAYEQLKN